MSFEPIKHKLLFFGSPSTKRFACKGLVQMSMFVIPVSFDFSAKVIGGFLQAQVSSIWKCFLELREIPTMLLNNTGVSVLFLFCPSFWLYKFDFRETLVFLWMSRFATHLRVCSWADMLRDWLIVIAESFHSLYQPLLLSISPHWWIRRDLHLGIALLTS